MYNKTQQDKKTVKKDGNKRATNPPEQQVLLLYQAIASWVIEKPGLDEKTALRFAIHKALQLAKKATHYHLQNEVIG